MAEEAVNIPRKAPERSPRALPGSAWDTWHLAGWDYATVNPSASDDDVKFAAVDYAMEKPFPIEVVKRAFSDGAKDRLRSPALSQGEAS